MKIAGWLVPELERCRGLPGPDRIQSGQQTWHVVCLFEADSGLPESEIRADARVLQGVYRRGNSFQLVLARLESPASPTRW